MYRTKCVFCSRDVKDPSMAMISVNEKGAIITCCSECAETMRVFVKGGKI